MKCPACKNEIPSGSIICPNCNSKVGSVCPKCGNVNPINSLKCNYCGKELLRVCGNCGAVNSATAKKCRKCGVIINNSDDKNDDSLMSGLDSRIKPTRSEIVKLLTTAVLEDEKYIMSLSGVKGSGKDFILGKLQSKLKNSDWKMIKATCSPLSQLTVCGFVQEMLSELMKLPDFCINNSQFQKDAVSYFKNEFPCLNNDEADRLINMLYPFKTDFYENIFENKQKSIDIIMKVFAHLQSDKKILLVINNFDFIDAMSYEFLKNLIKIEDIFKNLKILMTYSEPRLAQSYLYLEDKKYAHVYLNLEISPMTPVEAVDVYKCVHDINRILPDSEKREIYKKSKGNPGYIKSGIDFKNDCLRYGIDFILPLTLDELVERRLYLLKNKYPIAFDLLICASVIGQKIDFNLMKEVFQLKAEEALNIFNALTDYGYIRAKDEFIYEFVSSYLWESISKISKNEPNFIDINKRIYSILKGFNLKSNTLMAIILQNLHNKNEALEVWTKNANLCSYIGDVNLYIISQKQCLALINELDDNKTLNIRFNISERLGKILTLYKSSEALDYLPDAISNAQGIGNSVKEIELLSYMVQSCQYSGKYFGVVESVNRILEKLSPEKDLEIALIKVSKLKALLSIGNCGEVTDLINNDILPVIDKYLGGKAKNKNISHELLYDTWLKTCHLLGEAYVLQGDKSVREVISLLTNAIERGQIQDNDFLMKCHLLFAFADTICGDYTNSNRHLQEILDASNEVKLSNENILKWNFINIINRFMNKEYDNIQEDLFEIVTFANNNFDTFTKNFMKTLLGKIFADNEQISKGLEIYNEQLEHFSNEKIALGALLCWYFIAESIMNTEGPDKAIDIAQKALDVANNPKISNNIFQILLLMTLAKAFTIKGDFVTVKMYLEQGLRVAQQNELNDLIARLYLLYGKLYQEMGLKKSPHQKDFLQMANVMYERSLKTIRKIQNNSLFREQSKAQKVLNSFKELSGIKE
ncbi:zinc ribbon domain-containing protein [bacterium]|nr:zinc ribbon domain-containing protein [bacterium]